MRYKVRGVGSLGSLGSLDVEENTAKGRGLPCFVRRSTEREMRPLPLGCVCCVHQQKMHAACLHLVRTDCEIISPCYFYGIAVFVQGPDNVAGARSRGSRKGGKTSRKGANRAKREAGGGGGGGGGSSGAARRATRRRDHWANQLCTPEWMLAVPGDLNGAGSRVGAGE